MKVFRRHLNTIQEIKRIKLNINRNNRNSNIVINNSISMNSIVAIYLTKRNLVLSLSKGRNNRKRLKGIFRKSY